MLGPKDKVKKLLGPDAPEPYSAKPKPAIKSESKPWYLQPAYDSNEILIDANGSVRGGTIEGLVERLTAHEMAGTFSFADSATVQTDLII